MSRIRAGIIVAVAGLLNAAELDAQMRPSAVARPAPRTGSAIFNAVPGRQPGVRGVLVEATPYVDWGIAIGAGGGVLYGLFSGDDDSRGLLALGYGIAGIAAGFVGGMLTYFLVKLGGALAG